MHTLPQTSTTHYITGKAALNVPNADGSFADWHFDEVFLSGRGKIRIAGVDTESTQSLLGAYGIRECSDTLRRFGVAVPMQDKVYTANHVRAILDMVMFSLSKQKYPAHVSVDDLIENAETLGELRTQVFHLKTRITDHISLSLLTQWEQTTL